MGWGSWGLGSRRRRAPRRARQGGKNGVKRSWGGDGFFIERYIYRLIDERVTLLFMKPSTRRLAQWQKQYARLREPLGRVGWISEGYVQDRGPGAGGPCYQWTRKVRGKTVSVALSRPQYEWLRAAIDQWRHVQATLREMQRLSRQVLCTTGPIRPAARNWAKGP